MLKRIYIQNFALIDTLDIELHRGLQVITGETGAGKSIILGALRLILGERADLKTIQNSDSKSIVEAEFEVSEKLRPFFEENDLDFETSTIIRREILPSGKSRAFINDVPATLDVLKGLSSRLVDIHSQFETSDLFSEAYQFRILDGISGSTDLVLAYQKEFSQLKDLRRTRDILREQLAEGNRDAEYKNFLLNELAEADLDHTDWDDLNGKLALQENAETIAENLSLIFNRMDQEEVGVLDALLDIRTKLGRVAELSHQFTELNDRFESLFVEFKDVLFELQNKAEKIESDPRQLEVLQEKINLIHALFVKHNVQTVENLCEIRDRLAGEQVSFSGIAEQLAETENQIGIQEMKLADFSDKISAKRKKGIPVFVKKAESLFAKLGLEKAKIDVELSPSGQYSPFGNESVAILFQANTGFPMRPIQTAVSGGERSRVMLAVKKIMAENADLPTLILDEIDTGVSGKVAGEIGALMQEMSQHMQLIVITHLAQVAARGDNNYKVVKEDAGGRTRSDIIPLDSGQKLREIAQLLSGATVTEAALKQAEELMK
ncbi:DNA repair protein RecN [Daejeonia sp. YH14]|uniref:DNA repair protein RecN n=1 Tax=Daejeonia sp. YH14 TaxID=3439042 RepID=UPI003F491FC9